MTLTSSAKKSETWSTAWSAMAPSNSSLPASPNLLAQYLAIAIDLQDRQLPHGQGGLERGPLLLLNPLVLVGDPGLGQDQPGRLGPAHQVEVDQLDPRHDSVEFKGARGILTVADNLSECR